MTVDEERLWRLIQAKGQRHRLFLRLLLVFWIRGFQIKGGHLVFGLEVALGIEVAIIAAEDTAVFVLTRLFAPGPIIGRDHLWVAWQGSACRVRRATAEQGFCWFLSLREEAAAIRTCVPCVLRLRAGIRNWSTPYVKHALMACNRCHDTSGRAVRDQEPSRL